MKPARLLFLVLATTVIAAPRASAEAVSFTNDVMAVLSKAGCNMGACHGNANGKGGFRLSLRGQDPAFDHLWLTKESQGRRVNSVDPQRSLLLLKPTGRLAHQGGRRFREGSREYRILRDWIAAGAPGPDLGETQLSRLDVSPLEQVLVEPDDRVQLDVVAHFTDGTQRDVTDLTTFELSNLAAAIEGDGLVRREAFGETTAIARYLNQQVPIRLAFVPARDDFVWSEPPRNNFIDEHVFDRLRTLRMNPSELADDHVFVRRAFLDAIGVLPTADEARQFCDDPSPDKRRRLIKRLLTRDEFADHWALKWADILRNEEKVLDRRGVEAFHAWIRASIADEKPIDQFVRELLRAEGSTYDEPAANYWRANRDPSLRAETTARLFLGSRLQCAKCHNHPFDRWTQDDYYSFAAVFARIDYEIVDNKRKDRFDKNEFVGEQVVKIGESGQVRDPRDGAIVWPKLLGGDQLSPGAYHDRLVPLAVWLTSGDNGAFARTQVNFVWYHLLGRGLVEPIDDFRSTNPASNPALLDALADDFVASEFSLRQLVSRIMNSRVYQLSAVPNETNREDDSNFARAIIYRLPAEKLLDAQSQVIDSPADFAGYDPGIRAMQLPGVRKVRLRDGDQRGGDRFLKTFGKPERLLACECERSNETTLAQAFVLIGGDVNERLAADNTRLSRLAAATTSDEQLVTELYWTALSRSPNEDELRGAMQLLAEAGVSLNREQRAWASLFSQFGFTHVEDDRFTRIQDLTWALLNSKEFVFRH